MLEALRDFMPHTDIPLTFVIAFLALRVTLHFLEPKGGWWRLVLLYVIHYYMAGTLYFVGIGWYQKPLGMFLLFVCGICFLCKGSLLARISMGVLLAVLPLSMNAAITSTRHPLDRFVYVFMVLIWGGVLLFVHKALPRDARPPIVSGRLWALVDLLALMPLGATFAVIALTEPERIPVNDDPLDDILHVPNEDVLIMILCLAAIAAVGLFVAVVVLSRYEKMVREQLLLQMRSQCYQGMEEAQRQIRILRHDMANHLTTLSHLKGEAKDTYMDELIASPAMRSGRHFCENEVVNAVFAAKVPQMEADGISVDLDLSLPASLPLSDIDACALFANSLDNAIEASRRLPEEQRAVSAHAAIDKGLFVLKTVNVYTGALTMEDGRVVSTKEDRSNHGLGLMGIREIAERYGGSAEIETTESSFCLVVIIPVKQYDDVV